VSGDRKTDLFNLALNSTLNYLPIPLSDNPSTRKLINSTRNSQRKQADEGAASDGKANR
jgi:hypothetical protein